MKNDYLLKIIEETWQKKDEKRKRTREEKLTKKAWSKKTEEKD